MGKSVHSGICSTWVWILLVVVCSQGRSATPSTLNTAPTTAPAAGQSSGGRAEEAEGPDAQWTSYLEAGQKAYAAAQYDQAEKMFSLAVKIAEEFGPLDPRLALSLNSLASVCRLQDKYAQAKPLYHRALTFLQVAPGPDHPSVATSLNGLAGLYKDQAKYVQTEPLYQRALSSTFALSDSSVGFG